MLQNLNVQLKFSYYIQFLAAVTNLFFRVNFMKCIVKIFHQLSSNMTKFAANFAIKYNEIFFYTGTLSSFFYIKKYLDNYNNYFAKYKTYTYL